MSPVKKPKFVRKFGFTDRELQILKALAMYRSINSASKVVRVSPGTIRTTLYRIRRRYDNARSFIDSYHRWKKEMPLRKYL